MLARAWWEQGLAANPLPIAKLSLLAQRVYEQCDAKDGLKDGLIDDPRRCGFQSARDLPRCAESVDNRPLCAYPQVARYKGSGSIDGAANFACSNP